MARRGGIIASADTNAKCERGSRRTVQWVACKKCWLGELGGLFFSRIAQWRVNSQAYRNAAGPAAERVRRWKDHHGFSNSLESNLSSILNSTSVRSFTSSFVFCVIFWATAMPLIILYSEWKISKCELP